MPHPQQRETNDLLRSEGGAGPLLQRDYWAVIAGCRLKPDQFGQLLATRFEELAPPELVQFGRQGPEALSLGDELHVKIRFVGTFRVRVVHMNHNSITVATLQGHPEAGRITFGAYRCDDGEVIFHIRSRARSSSLLRYLGFRVLGEAMQTNTWCDFVERVAACTGEGVRGAIHESTTRVDRDDDEDRPTFLAKGQ